MGIHFHQRDNFVRIVELTPELRREIERTVESLIALLDQYDGDENTEDDGTAEPVLGWTGEGIGCIPLGIDGGDDRELEDEHDEDGNDDEPTLGAPERHPASWDRTDMDGVLMGRTGELRYDRTWAKSQQFWADGPTTSKMNECEQENEYGGDILDEAHDAEPDDEDDDNGIADLDGASEQYGSRFPLGLEFL